MDEQLISALISRQILLISGSEYFFFFCM